MNRRERIQTEGEKRLNKYGKMLFTNTQPWGLILSLQAHFLFAARVFIWEAPRRPTPAKWGPQTAPQWRLCALNECQTCPYRLQATHPVIHPYNNWTAWQALPSFLLVAVFHDFKMNQTWWGNFVIKLQIVEQECLSVSRGSFWILFSAAFTTTVLFMLLCVMSCCCNLRCWWECSLVSSSTQNWLTCFPCVVYVCLHTAFARGS